MRAAAIPSEFSFGPRWLHGAFIGGAALANVAIAIALANGKAIAVVSLVLLLITLFAMGALLFRHGIVLIWVALALDFTGIPFLTKPLPLPGGAEVFVTDIILLLALGLWVVERLARPDGPRKERALPLVLTWPLLAFAVAIAIGAVRGNINYGSSLLGQPIRFIVYAGIAVAIANTTVPALWRGITVVFYSCAVATFFYTVYYLVVGGSMTNSATLSTGGTRTIALSTATYLVGSLVCALLNLERTSQKFLHQIGHAAIAGLSFCLILVAFGRTTYVAVALILPALFLARKALRRSVLLLLPLLLPALIALVLIAPVVQPTLTSTLASRLTVSPSSDINVIWRSRAREVSTAGIGESLTTGFGFGRPARFALQGQVYDVTGDPHNSYVYLLAGGGLLALGSLVALMLAYVYDLIRRYRTAIDLERMLLVFSLSTWVAFMLNAYYGPVLTNATMLMTIWILMVMPWAVPIRRGDATATEALSLPQRQRSTGRRTG